MARKIPDIRVTGVRFGDWKLIPVDNRSWELAHYRESTDRKTGATSIGWCREGRYFDYTGIGHALQCAADWEIKEGSRERCLEIREALKEYERIIKEFTYAVDGRLLEKG